MRQTMTQAEEYGAQFADLVDEIVEQAVDEETDEEYGVTLFTFRDGSQMVEYKGGWFIHPKAPEHVGFYTIHTYMGDEHKAEWNGDKWWIVEPMGEFSVEHFYVQRWS